ncbi:MAG: phosphotransferase, partial [Microcystaceae cyanobacterium]
MHSFRSLSSLNETSPLFLKFPSPSSDEDFFPAVYSTFAPQALTHLVSENYHVEVIKGCRFWHRGLSDVYLVETLDQSYILRISHHHWRTQSDIQFELEFLTFLTKYQIPVAAPLRTKEGKLKLEIKAVEGERYAALFPVALGSVAIGDLNKTQGFLLGEVVAKLHEVAAQFKPSCPRSSLNLNYLLDQSLAAIAPFLDHRLAEWKYLMEASLHIKKQTKCLPMEPPYWTVCWGDPHSGNVHFTVNNQLTLFDFDQCGFGWRAFDVAKFLQVSLQTGLNRAVRDSFLAGYQSITPLTFRELDCLQVLTQVAYIWSWAIHLNSIKLYDYSRLDARYFTCRVQQL